MAQKISSNRWIWILLGIVVILTIIAIIRGNRAPEGLEVTTEKVHQRTIIERVAASGKVFPEKEVKISSDVSGEIVQLPVLEGDSVVTGQLLANIDPDSYISAVERGRASLNNARAQLSMARASVENNRAQKEQIEAQLSNARKIHERNQKLYEDGVISEAEFESSKSNVESLEANLRSAEANLRSAKNNVEAAQYSIESAKASLEELQTSLEKTTIKAPTSGIISQLNVEEGERVVGTMQMAGTELMRIANLNTMEVRVEVSENDIIRVSMGDTTEIDVDAYMDRTFRGVVTEIANSATASSGTGQMALTTDQVTNFVVKIRILPSSYQDLVKPDDRYPFRPGMSASVEILTDRAIDVLSIPIQSVTARERDDKEKEDRGAFQNLQEIVFRSSGDTVQAVGVKTGIQDDEYIHIKEGLNDGDEIITGPYSAISRELEEGDHIDPKKEKEEKARSNTNE